MGSKRSLEIRLKAKPSITNPLRFTRDKAVTLLDGAGIQIANYGPLWVQVRETTPTQVRETFRNSGISIRSIQDGFSR